MWNLSGDYFYKFIGCTIQFNLSVDNLLEVAVAVLHNNDGIYIHTRTCFSWLMLRAGD